MKYLVSNVSSSDLVSVIFNLKILQTMYLEMIKIQLAARDTFQYPQKVSTYKRCLAITGSYLRNINIETIML